MLPGGRALSSSGHQEGGELTPWKLSPVSKCFRTPEQGAPEGAIWASSPRGPACLAQLSVVLIFLGDK